MTVTIGVLASAAGIITSIIFEFLPKLHDGYNKLPDNFQKLIMVGATLVTGAGAFALSCWGVLVQLFPGVVLPCTQPTVMGLLSAWLIAFFTSQGTFLGLLQKKPELPGSGEGKG